MHLPWDITDGLAPKKMAVHKHTVHHLIDGRPMRRFAKISSNSYFLLQLLKKFSRCVCQILMKFLLAGPIQRRSSLASSTDLSFLLGAKSLPAVWSFSKYCYTLQMRQRQRQRQSLLQQILSCSYIWGIRIQPISKMFETTFFWIVGSLNKTQKWHFKVAM